MKRLIAILGVLAFTASLVGAQEGARSQLMKRLNLTEEQADRLVAIYADSAEELARARAEINVQKAVLTRLLLDVNVSEREVEKALRQAMEAEVQVRMIQIRRELAARKLIGEKRYRQLRDLLRRFALQKTRTAAQNAPSRPAPPQLDAKEQAFLQELADLLGD